MSIVNKVKNFFSRSYVSHYNDNGNLKDFEHFRIDLVKELDYMALQHNFNIREKLTTAALYNLFQSSIGDFINDISDFAPVELIYDLTKLSIYFLTLTVDYSSAHRINLLLYYQIVKERFSSPGAFFLGPKVSEFHWYGYMLDDPYHYPPSQGYYGREYEDLIRASSLDFYHDHKKMIEYDNSTNLKLAIISFTDIAEDTASFVNSSFKIIWNLMWFKLGSFKNSLLDSSYHLVKVFYDIAAGGVYTICAFVENFDPYVESSFESFDNIVISKKNYIKYYIDDKLNEFLDEYAKNVSSKLFDIFEHSYFVFSDIVKLLYHIITLNDEKIILDIHNTYLATKGILTNLKDIVEYFIFQTEQFIKDTYYDIFPLDRTIEQIDYLEEESKSGNFQEFTNYTIENFYYYLDIVNSQISNIQCNISEAVNHIYDNCVDLFGVQAQVID